MDTYGWGYQWMYVGCTYMGPLIRIPQKLGRKSPHIAVGQAIAFQHVLALARCNSIDFLRASRARALERSRFSNFSGTNFSLLRLTGFRVKDKLEDPCTLPIWMSRPCAFRRTRLLQTPHPPENPKVSGLSKVRGVLRALYVVLAL